MFSQNLLRKSLPFTTLFTWQPVNKEEEAAEDGKRQYLAFVHLFTQSEANKELACWRVLYQLLALHQSHGHNRSPQLTLPQCVRQTKVLRSARYLGGNMAILYREVWNTYWKGIRKSASIMYENNDVIIIKIKIIIIIIIIITSSGSIAIIGSISLPYTREIISRAHADTRHWRETY